MTKTTCYVVNNVPYATFEQAQIAEIIDLLAACDTAMINDYAVLLVKAKDRVIDILTTTAKSRPKARKVNGGSKKRTVAKAEVAA